MIPFRSAILACLIAAAAAAEPADPAATVKGWITALQANDLAGAWDKLPEAQRTAWAPSLGAAPAIAPAPAAPAADAPAAPPEAGGQRGQRGGRGMLDGALRMLTEGDQAGRLLSATLASFAGTVAVDGKVPASAPLSADQPFLAFMPRMAAAGALGGVMNGILARGLETQQIAAIDAWAVAYAAWAKTAPLADEARAAAALPHVQAFANAIRATPNGADARAVLVAWGGALPRLKQALAVYGLDADAAFASARTEAAPAAADGTVVVTVRFTAFGAEQVLPLKMKLVDGGWEIAADSPAPRWLRGGAGGMGGGAGMGGGRMGGGRRGGNNNGPGAGGPPPADTPKQGPVGF